MVELMMDMLDFCCLLWPGCGVWRADFHVAGMGALSSTWHIWRKIFLPRGIQRNGGKERNGGKSFSTSGANYVSRMK